MGQTKNVRRSLMKMELNILVINRLEFAFIISLIGWLDQNIHLIPKGGVASLVFDCQFPTHDYSVIFTSKYC